MNFIKTEKLEALKYNHHDNCKPHRNREKFFAKVAENEITSENVIESMKKYYKAKMSKRIIGKAKRIVKKIIRRK